MIDPIVPAVVAASAATALVAAIKTHKRSDNPKALTRKQRKAINKHIEAMAKEAELNAFIYGNDLPK